MRFNPSEEQVLIKDMSARLFARESPIAVVRQAEKTGYSADLWEKISRTGLLSLGLSSSAAMPGEVSGSVERVLVAEEYGRNLAPVPLLETWAATRLLSHAQDEQSKQILAALTAGKLILSVAPKPDSDRKNLFVPSGKIARAIIVLHEGSLFLHEGAAVSSSKTGRLGVSSAGIWNVSSAGGSRLDMVPGTQPIKLFESCLREWKIVLAAALNGLSARALEIATEYAKTRMAFGVSIATFQAVSHPLADAATLIEGSKLLTLEAAWAEDAKLPQAPALASMAFVAAARAATQITRAAIHIHGGYGITEEYDIQLFFKRAKGWSLSLADQAMESARIGKLLVETTDTDRDLLPPWYFERASTATGMGYDFGLGTRYGKFRKEIRSFLMQSSFEISDCDRGTTAATEGFSRTFHVELGRRGLIAMGWPKEYGGNDKDAVEITIFDEELSNASGHHNSPLMTSRLVAATIIAAGSERQKEEYLPRIASGELIIALGYTEPGSGSDASAAKTRAVRHGDDWIIDGQKMFTTSADFADYVFLLARTNFDKPNHRGLTMFLVPLHTKGIDVTPIRTIGGVSTTTTFYSSVRISDSQRVGEIDGGWQVMSSALKLEHGTQSYHWLTAKLLRDAISWVHLTQTNWPDEPIDSYLAGRLGNAAVSIEVAKLLSYRSAWYKANRIFEVDERGPMSKLYSSDTLTQCSSDLLDMLGSDSVMEKDGGDDFVAGVEHVFLVGPGTTTYGGTVEVMRSLLAERYLGLPRSR